MLKATIKKLMKDHLICTEEEARQALGFISDIIDAEIVFIENTEPYATRTIAEMKEVNSRIGKMLDPLG